MNNLDKAFDNIFIGVYDINKEPIYTNKQLFISYRDYNGLNPECSAVGVFVYNKNKLCFEFKVNKPCSFTGEDFTIINPNHNEFTLLVYY